MNAHVMFAQFEPRVNGRVESGVLVVQVRQFPVHVGSGVGFNVGRDVLDDGGDVFLAFLFGRDT
jgi:hypothetical protein